jgi:exodeoxyribonuclease V gamma subunit
LQNRLGVFLGDDPRLVEDREPIELDSLERWELGTVLLERAVKHEESSSVQSVVSATGFLPHGTPGALAYQDIWAEAQQIATRAAAWLSPQRLSPLELSLSLEGTQLTGYLRQLFPKAQVYYQYARVKAKNEVSLWVRHLALNAAATPSVPRVSVLLGRRLDESRPETAGIVFDALEPDEARELLRGLVVLYQAGHERPLPLFPAASKAFVQHLASQKGPVDEQKALAKAQQEFAPSFGGAIAEGADPYIARVFSGENPLLPDSTSSITRPKHCDFRLVSQQLFLPMLRFARTEGGA